MKTFYIAGRPVKLCTGQKSGQFNGLFTATGVRGVLEGKDHHAMYIVFIFVATFIDRVTGYTDGFLITDTHTAYLDLVNVLLFHRDDFEHIALEVVSKDIRDLKQKAARVFDTLEGMNLFTLKFHMLDHTSTDLSLFGDLYALDASALVSTEPVCFECQSVRSGLRSK